MLLANQQRHSSKLMHNLLRCTLFAAALYVSCIQVEGASKTLLIDGTDCSYHITFDPQKLDENRVKDSAELVYDDDLFAKTFASEPHVAASDTRARADLERFADNCDRKVKRLDDLHLIDVPGIEKLRQERRAIAIDRCHLVSAMVRAARGDIDALEAYTPARAHCARYVDSLHASVLNFPTTWQRFVIDQCRGSSASNCEGRKLADAQNPNNYADLRVEMLEAGWYNCANTYSRLNKGYQIDRNNKFDRSPKTDLDRLLISVKAAYSKKLKVVDKCDMAD